MERQSTASPPGVKVRTADSTGKQRAGALRRQRKQPTAAEPGRMLRSVASWKHTLVLTGTLTHRTAHALEIEIERLYEEGVTAIVLDLRELAGIDPVGVAVIAFRCGLCERRGYGFELLAGSKRVQRAFAEAGVADLLPFVEEEQEAAPPAVTIDALLDRPRPLEGCEG